MSHPPLLYVCGPVRTATVREKDLELRVRREALARGWAPIWGPALLGDLGLSEEVHEDRALALAVDVGLVKRCDALVVCGSRITEGMRVELEEWAKNPRLTFVAFDDAFLGLSRVIKTSTIAITAHDWRDEPQVRLGVARAEVNRV